MLKKLGFLVVIIAALIGAGFGFAYKDALIIRQRISTYQNAIESGNYKRAYTLADQLLRGGHMQAHYFLGNLYENGYGVTVNIPEAVAHYKLAASANDANAQARLGELYIKGKGVEKDEKRAAYWYEKSAANGLPNAQYHLGNMYKNGTGVTKDTNKARTLLVSASKQGVLEANRDLAKIASLEMGLR